MLFFMGVTFIFGIISGILYRFGKSQKRNDFLDFLREPGVRDVGCTLLSLIWIFMFIPMAGIPLWKGVIAYICSAGITYGFITTYWDRLFGFDNFYAHGFGISLGGLPFAILLNNWVGFGLRCIALAALMGLWCKYFSNHIVEENGRGNFIQLTLPFLKIGV